MSKILSNVFISYFLAVLSGVLLFLSMPSYHFSIFAWFGLIPLLLTLDGKTRKHQYFLINIAAIIWSIGTHIWYPSIFSYWGFLIMIGAGLFNGAFIQMGYDMQNRIKGWYRIFSIPITFSVFEWIKTVIPFTKSWWIETISKSQWMVPEHLQILSITGFIGLSFLILLTNVIITEIIKTGYKDKKMLIPYLLLSLFPIANFIYGNVAMYKNDHLLNRESITIGATVDMINQDKEVLSLGGEQNAGDGYLADTPDMKQKIFEINSSLSKEMVNEKQPDVIVWGENEFMNLHDKDLYDNLMQLSNELHAKIVADTVWNHKDKMYDTALMVDSDKKEIGRTPKIFILGGEESHGFSHGPKSYPVYKTSLGETALAVCWDRHDPSILRNYVKNGAKLALIPADDDFNGNTHFPYFAASDAVFRAVENHLAIGSGSTSGIAEVITPYGDITAISDVNKRQYIMGETFITKDKTFYTKYGDVFAYFISFLFIVGLIISERNKRKSNHNFINK